MQHINKHLQNYLQTKDSKDSQPVLPFLVVGVYDAHFREHYCKPRNWHVEEQLIDFSKEDRSWDEGKTNRSRQRKHFYLRRPQLNLVRDLNTNARFYVFVVFLGKDYIEHYASMIRCGFELLKPQCTLAKDADRLLRVEYYPTAYQEMPNWCGLSEFRFQQGDVVLMGYVGFFRAWLISQQWFRQITTSTDPNTWEEHEACGFFVGEHEKFCYRIVLFGFHFSFWGNIAERLVQHFCDNGVSEVLYFGKRATLRKEEDIHDIIVTPSEYAVCSGANRVTEVRPPPVNPFSGHQFQESLSILPAAHISVPTIVGETFEQRDAIGERYQTMDNEIAQIARLAAKEGLRFGCLHFCTDFVRPRAQAGDITRNDLNRNKHDQERVLMPKIFETLNSYLSSS